MASKSRSAAAKKAWATRRKLYGASGVGKKGGSSTTSKKSPKMSTSLKRKIFEIKRDIPISGTKKQILNKFKRIGLNKTQAEREYKKFTSF